MSRAFLRVVSGLLLTIGCKTRRDVHPSPVSVRFVLSIPRDRLGTIDRIELLVHAATITNTNPCHYAREQERVMLICGGRLEPGLSHATAMADTIELEVPGAIGAPYRIVFVGRDPDNCNTMLVSAYGKTTAVTRVDVDQWSFGHSTYLDCP